MDEFRRGIRRDASVDAFAQSLRGAHQRQLRDDGFLPTVRRAAVRLHNAGRDLRHLAGMTAHEQVFDPQFSRGVQHKADLVAHLHDRKAASQDLQRRFALVAEREGQFLMPLLRAHLQFHVQGIPQRFQAHGTKDARRPENGQAAFDAQPGIERFQRRLFAARDRYRDTGSPAAEYAAHGLLDHLPRHRIDGSFAYGDLQPRLCDDAHAVARAERDGSVSVQQFHPADDLHAVRDVRVVAAVFIDAAAAVLVRHDIGPVDLTAGHFQFYGVRTEAVPLPQTGGQSSRRRTASCCKAFSQFLHVSIGSYRSRTGRQPSGSPSRTSAGSYERYRFSAPPGPHLRSSAFR